MGDRDLHWEGWGTGSTLGGVGTGTYTGMGGGQGSTLGGVGTGPYTGRGGGQGSTLGGVGDRGLHWEG